MGAGAIIPGDIRPLPAPGVKTKGEASPAQAATSGGTALGATESVTPSPQNTAFLGQRTIPAGVLFQQSAAALNLPIDTLSLTLLAFSRFFSLTPSQALLTTLRREVLSSSKTSSPQTTAEKAAFEAKAMAASAAFDKGLSLSGEAFERYARFLEAPAHQGDRDAGGKDAMPGGGKGNSPDREEVPTKEELQTIAEEEAKKDKVLDFLNSVPGKNGQYWVVLPFDINVKGTELKVVMRILKGGPLFTGGNEHLIVDITGPKRQYRCFLKKNDGKLRVKVRVYPELSARALKLLSKKAEKFFGEGSAFAGSSFALEELIVQNGEGAATWTDNWSEEYLPAIDKEV